MRVRLSSTQVRRREARSLAKFAVKLPGLAAQTIQILNKNDFATCMHLMFGACHSTIKAMDATSIIGFVLIIMTASLMYLWPKRYLYLLWYRMRIMRRINSNALTNSRQCLPWIKATDVIVAVPGKSGTTWLQHMCHQLRMRGAPPTFESQVLLTFISLFIRHMCGDDLTRE
jgi:hypothetical protein